MSSAKLKTVAQLTARGRTAFSYRTLESTTSRRSPHVRTSHELVVMGREKRESMSATVRDDRRNFTLLAWMIRRHIDNCARFTPLVKTGDTKVDDVLRKLFRWHARRQNFDATGRHGRDEFMRMFEACKVIGGDAGAMKARGGKFQGIEGDRLAIPAGGQVFEAPDGTKFNEEGLDIDKNGVRRSWCLCKRAGVRGAQLEFERKLPASDLIFDGYWPERFDSNRGVSPLVTALNDAVDVRESCEWIVLKIKQSGLFGLAFTRTGSQPLTPPYEEGETAAAADAPTTEAQSYSAQLAAAVKSRGLINLDLDPGDTVAEIESKTPSSESVRFILEMVRFILAALDIPYSFYDSRGSTFSSRIADRNEYEESCEWKRDKNVDVLFEMHEWLFPIWAAADLMGFGAALKAAKMSPLEALAGVKWIPAGKPWMDRGQEMAGHAMALACGITSVPRVCALYGEDANEIAEEQREYLKSAGIPLAYIDAGKQAVQLLMQPKDTTNGNEDQPK